MKKFLGLPIARKPLSQLLVRYHDALADLARVEAVSSTSPNAGQGRVGEEER
jgi:hypothetical protein